MQVVTPAARQISFVVLATRGERFLFFYDDTPESRAMLLKSLCAFADDPELNFTWSDAAVLAGTVRRLAADRKAELAVERSR